jgi:uncharacterized protein
MEIIGFICALFMGLSLGLIGGGGSILTVPILIYLFSIDTVLATAYSLFIVGITSLVGSFSHIWQGNVHWRTAIVFGIPSIISVYLTRHYLVPFIPNEVLSISGFVVSKSLFLLLIFSILMIFASYTMIRECKTCTDEPKGDIDFNYPLILIEGLVVGTVTGLVGAGGGFLIIPALVLLAKLPMKQAVGTSLVIIALKSLIGFTGDLKTNNIIDWSFLSYFSAIAIVGIILGSLLSKKVPNKKLKPAFGYFVLVMGMYILTNELFLKHN